MRKWLLAWALSVIAVVAFAQGITSVLPGPGTVHSTGAAGYVGPCDNSVGGPCTGFNGFRAASNAAAAAHVKAVKIFNGVTTCDAVVDTAGDLDQTTLSCVGGTVNVPTFCVSSCQLSGLYDQISTNDILYQSNSVISITLNCQNSHPCAVTPGSLTGYSTTGNDPLTAPQSASVVANRTSSSSFGALIGTSDFQYYLGYNNATNTARLASNTAAFTASVSDGAWHALSGVSNGASSIITIDGSDTTGTVTTSVSSTGQLTLAGQGPNGAGDPFVGSLAEVIVWSNVALSSGQRSALHTNQSAYWGTP